MKYKGTRRVGICAAVAASACAVGLRPMDAKASAPKNVMVGRFHVPVLSSNWRRSTYAGSTGADVNYSKKVQDTEVTVIFAQSFQLESEPATAQVLKKNADFMQEVYSTRSTSLKVLESKPTQFRTYTAYLQRVRAYHKPESKPESKLGEWRSLSFIYRDDIYTLTVILRGKQHSPQAKAVAEQAWQTMTQKLQPVSDKYLHPYFPCSSPS